MSLFCSIIGNVDCGKSTFCNNLKKHSNILQKNITQDIIPFIYKHYGTNIVLLDTPGHDCFEEMRIQTIQMSHIVLFFVEINNFGDVDIEYLKLIKELKKPFILIINKCDTIEKSQINHQIKYFKLKLAEQGFNSEHFKKNKNIKTDVSIIPISAKSNLGVKNLLNYLAKIKEFIKFKNNKGYIIENREFKSKGTLTQILSNVINKKQIIHYITSDMKYQNEELGLVFDENIKSKQNINNIGYIKLKTLPMPGTPFYIENTNAENEETKIKKYIKKLQKNSENITTFDNGIVVIAPTYTKLLALQKYIKLIKIKEQPIQVKKFIISNKVQKKHLLLNKTMKTNNIIDDMHNEIYNTTLFFGNDNTDNVLSSNNIYSLFNQYINYVHNIFDSIINLYPNLHKPCLLEILDEHIYHKKNPIIIGVNVKKGILYNNILIKSNDTNKILGTVISIEKDSKPMTFANENDKICLKINSELSFNKMMTMFATYYSKEEKYIMKKYNWLNSNK